MVFPAATSPPLIRLLYMLRKNSSDKFYVNAINFFFPFVIYRFVLILAKEKTHLFKYIHKQSDDIKKYFCATISKV